MICDHKRSSIYDIYEILKGLTLNIRSSILVILVVVHVFVWVIC